MRLSPNLSIAKVDLSTPAAPNPPKKRLLEFLFIDHLVEGGGSHLYEIGISLSDLDSKAKALSSFPSLNQTFLLLGEVAQHFETPKEVELTTGEICCYKHLIQAFGGKQPLLDMLQQKEECLSFFMSLIESLRLPKQGALSDIRSQENLPLPDPSPLSFKDHLISADIQKIASPKIKQEFLERSTKVIASKKDNRLFKIQI